MLQRKRLLKKDKTKRKYKLLFLSFIIILVFSLLLKIILLNFSFGKPIFISPLSISKLTDIALIEMELSKNDIQFTNVETDNDLITIKLQNGSDVFLSSKKDIKGQVSSLQFILSRLTIEGKKPKVLDLRFDRPVISF